LPSEILAERGDICDEEAEAYNENTPTMDQRGQPKFPIGQELALLSNLGILD
jgi:hypothetical protein